MEQPKQRATGICLPCLGLWEHAAGKSITQSTVLKLDGPWSFVLRSKSRKVCQQLTPVRLHCSIASTGDPCVRPEGGLGMSGVPRLKLMLTQMQQEALDDAADLSAAPTYSRAACAAPEVRALLLLTPVLTDWLLSRLCHSS